MSAAGGGSERTARGLLPLVGLGDLTAWSDAPYCSQGRGGSEGAWGERDHHPDSTWKGEIVLRVCTNRAGGSGWPRSSSPGQALAETPGPLGSHMRITFLLLFLFIVLPCDTLAASHLFIHSQSLFQTWNSGLKPLSSVSRLMARLFFHGLHPLLLGSFDCAEHTLGNRHLAHVQFLEVRTVCGGGHVNSGVCTCVHVCVPICDVCFSPV